MGIKRFRTHMKIYVCHSSMFDYVKELYEPLRNSNLSKKYELILPHETSKKTFDSKKMIPSCDLIISEVSYPSTSMGIELGWANKDNKRILFIHKRGFKISNSLREVSSDFIEYSNSDDLIKKALLFIDRLQKPRNSRSRGTRI